MIGLGKTEQGITAPLLAKKTDGRSGVIVPGDFNSSKKLKLANSTVILLLVSLSFYCSFPK
jgi:hypothetical protein